MVRIRRAARALGAAAACALLLLPVLARPAAAQSLQRLTVTAFTLTADTAKPELEVPFHIVVSLHVRENVPQIDHINLPILAELELLGDERSTQSTPSGTDYRETITVVAHHTGKIALSPVTLQAIDARDGKPKQYFTNPLTLDVTGGALEPIGAGTDFAALIGGVVVRSLLWILGIACAVAVIALFLRRRPARPVPAPLAPPPVPAPPKPVPARSRRERLQDALTVLRAERTRSTAVRVRAAVWYVLGAAEGETLADVLQRPDASEPGMRDVLRALERAAFTYDEDLARAIDDACNALERYVA